MRPPGSDAEGALPRGAAAGEAPPIGRTAVWFGILGGMTAWALHLGVSYAMVPYVCATTQEWLLHLMTAGLAAIALAAVAASWREHRRLSAWFAAHHAAGRETAAMEDAGGGPGVEAAVARRFNFLAVSAALLSGFFLLLILAEGLPALVSTDPCGPVPTLDRPIVLPGQPAMITAAGLLHGRGPPGPGEVWGAWNRDPWILGMLLVACVLYVRGVLALWLRAGRGRGIQRWRAVAYLGGLAALFAALVSPVDALGEALFSVHMVQHLLLMVVAAPLLALGRPIVAFLWSLPPRWRSGLGGWWRRARLGRAGWRALTFPATVLLLHVGALWLWHVPRMYEAALESRVVHHLEHASFFLSALLFWWVLARAGGRRGWPGYGAGVLYVFATALQSGALGALIMFAPRPWYTAHSAGAAAWGVDLLADQQLAGVLMWVPAGLIYAAAAVALFVALLRESDRKAAWRERSGGQWLTSGWPPEPRAAGGRPAGGEP